METGTDLRRDVTDSVTGSARANTDLSTCAQNPVTLQVTTVVSHSVLDYQRHRKTNQSTDYTNNNTIIIGIW